MVKSVLKYKLAIEDLECEKLEDKIYELAEASGDPQFYLEEGDFLTGNNAYLKFTPNNNNNKKSQYFNEETIYANSSIDDRNSVFYKSVRGYDIDIAILPEGIKKRSILPEDKEIRPVIFKHFRTGSKREINSGSSFDRYHDTEFKLLEYLATKIETQKKSTGFEGEIFGHITLYTRKIPCFSCDYVLIQFHEMYPNISVEVSYFKEN